MVVSGIFKHLKSDINPAALGAKSHIFHGDATFSTAIASLCIVAVLLLYCNCTATMHGLYCEHAFSVWQQLS